MYGFYVKKAPGWVWGNPNIAQVADQPIGAVRPTGREQVAGSAGLDTGFMSKVSSHVPTSIAKEQPATGPMSSLPPIGPAPAAVPPVDKRVIDQLTAPAMNMPFTGAPGHPVMNTGLPEPVTERPFNLTSEGPGLPHLETLQPNMAGGQASLAVDDGQLFNPSVRPDFEQEKAAPEAVTEDLSFVSPGMRQFLDDVSKRSGLDIRISNEMGQAKGLLQGQTVYLNEALFDGNPEYAVTSILTPELTHAMEGTSEYTRLADLAVEAMSADYGGMDFAGLVERKRQEYAAGGVTLDTDGEKKEIVAEFMEQAMSDPVTAQRLLTQEPGAFKRMLQWIKDALETIINKASLRKDKVAQAQYKCYRKAQKVFVEALNNNLAGKGEGQFAIDYVSVKTEDGHKVVPIVISEADLSQFGYDENRSPINNFYRMQREVGKELKSRLNNKTLIGADGREMITKYPSERYGLISELTRERHLKDKKTIHNRGLSYLDMALNVEEIAMTLKTLPKTEKAVSKHPVMAAKDFDVPMFLFRDSGGDTFICKAKVATDKNGVNTLYAIPSMKRFDLEKDTLTKEREGALNIVGDYAQAEQKEPPASEVLETENDSDSKGPGASTPQSFRSEDSFIGLAIPPDTPPFNKKFAISPHLETPIERGDRLAREMGLKEKGLKALKLDPLGRERVGSYKKYGPEMKGFADDDHLLGRLGNARSALYARLVDDASPLVRLSKALPEEYKNGEVDRVMIEDRLQQVRQAGGTVDYIAEKALLNANGQVIGDSWADMDALVPKKLRGEFNAYRRPSTSWTGSRKARMLPQTPWKGPPGKWPTLKRSTQNL